jgi:hypothetical protein
MVCETPGTDDTDDQGRPLLVVAQDHRRPVVQGALGAEGGD